MANTNVTLDCRNWANTDPANGYKTTNSSNNTPYSFKYTGGTDGAGGVDEVTGSGAATITVTVGTDPRYVVAGVTFTGDDADDFSWAPGSSANVAVITDLDTRNAQEYYSVLVRDSAANCTFTCDPPIRNKPS